MENIERLIIRQLEKSGTSGVAALVNLLCESSWNNGWERGYDWGRDGEHTGRLKDVGSFEEFWNDYINNGNEITL